MSQRPARWGLPHVDCVVKDLKIFRQTAAKYFDFLAEKGFVAKHRSGRSNHYVNTDLVRLFLHMSGRR